MQISFVGILICCGLLAMAQFSAAPLIVALIGSMAFGASAVVILAALGGSSPIIYVVFLLALYASVAMRPNIIGELGRVLSEQPASWLVLFLVLYTIAGAILLPRIFAGETTVFVPLRDENRIAEIPLVPVGGNITQTLYFSLGALAFFLFSVLLRNPRTVVAIRQGFLAWATLHVVLGFTDLFGKLAGLGDVLEPLRSASYAMLTNVEIGGFWRIAGGQPEASSFGADTIMLLAFTFVYWRNTRGRYALALTLALITLLVLSTATTAYVAGFVLLLILMFSITSSALRDRLVKQDLYILAGGAAALIAIFGLDLYDNALDPLWHLFDTTVFDKAASASAAERAYWNYRSLQSIYDTGGFGIGLGSSRASSWLIAVASQFGVVGSLIIGYFVVEIVVRGAGLHRLESIDPQARITALSLRAATFGGLITKSVSGGSANPGVIFFMTLAVVLSVRAAARRAHRYQEQTGLLGLAPGALPEARRNW